MKRNGGTNRGRTCEFSHQNKFVGGGSKPGATGFQLWNTQYSTSNKTNFTQIVRSQRKRRGFDSICSLAGGGGGRALPLISDVSELSAERSTHHFAAASQRTSSLLTDAEVLFARKCQTPSQSEVPSGEQERFATIAQLASSGA